jgi:hypothetical protein
MEYTRVYVHHSLSGFGLHKQIYGKCLFVYDGYGYGIDCNKGICNRVSFYDNKFVADYSPNLTQRKFLLKVARDFKFRQKIESEFNRVNAT